jgi:hypothetical protein
MAHLNLIEQTISSGALIVTVIDLEQPLASVAVYVYNFRQLN